MSAGILPLKKPYMADVTTHVHFKYVELSLIRSSQIAQKCTKQIRSGSPYRLFKHSSLPGDFLSATTSPQQILCNLFVCCKAMVSIRPLVYCLAWLPCCQQILYSIKTALWPIVRLQCKSNNAVKTKKTKVVFRFPGCAPSRTIACRRWRPKTV